MTIDSTNESRILAIQAPYSLVMSMQVTSPRRRRLWANTARAALALVLIGSLAAGISGCGRKGSPEHAPDSDYPRRYPAW